MKFNEKSLKQLKKGEVCLVIDHNTSLEDVDAILKKVFPKDYEGEYKDTTFEETLKQLPSINFIRSYPYNREEWTHGLLGLDKTIPQLEIKDFLKTSENEKKSNVTEEENLVNGKRPTRYASREVNGMDVIDLIEHWNLDFCRGNILKYLLRQKNQDESDLEKIIDYAQRKLKQLGNDK